MRFTDPSPKFRNLFILPIFYVMDSVLVPAEVAVTESFYNQYLESGNNVEVIVDENAEHGFVRQPLQFSAFASIH